MIIFFIDKILEDYNYWADIDKKIFKKIKNRIGKVELLKNNPQGYWSRRICNEHRIVIKENKIN